MQIKASNTHPDFNPANMSSLSLPAANDTLPSASITGHCSQKAEFGTGKRSVFRAQGLTFSSCRRTCTVGSGYDVLKIRDRLH